MTTMSTCLLLCLQELGELPGVEQSLSALVVQQSLVHVFDLCPGGGHVKELSEAALVQGRQLSTRRLVVGARRLGEQLLPWIRTHKQCYFQNLLGVCIKSCLSSKLSC